MKIKNRNWHKKRYLENKMNDFVFVHDKRPHRKQGFNWINGTNHNPINDMKLWLENYQNSSLQ